MEVYHQPSTWTTLQGDWSIANGIYYDGNQRVTEISWWNNGLNGFQWICHSIGCDFVGVGLEMLTENIPFIFLVKAAECLVISHPPTGNLHSNSQDLLEIISQDTRIEQNIIFAY